MRTKLARMMTKGARQSRRAYPVKADRPLRILDKTKPLESAPEAADWLVVMVAPRREADAVTALQEAGYAAWRPQTTVWLTSARMNVKSKVNRPLFSRYIFVAQRPGITKAIVDCDHVTYIVGPAYRGRPFIEELSRRQEAGEYDATITKPIPLFRTGEQIHINGDTPFHGLNGIVDKSDGERVMIFLSLFGRHSRVEIDADMIEYV